MRMRFDVFGRELRVERRAGEWVVHEVGAEGKRRTARDITIPSGLAAGEVRRYLDDLCHEQATASRPVVVRLD